jgi:hypothetical protein
MIVADILIYCAGIRQAAAEKQAIIKPTVINSNAVFT